MIKLKGKFKRWTIGIISLLLTLLFQWAGLDGLLGLGLQASVAQTAPAQSSDALDQSTQQISAQENYANGNFARAIEQWSAERQQLQTSGDADGVSRLLIYEAQALESLGQSRRACNTLLRSLNATVASCNELRVATGEDADLGGDESLEQDGGWAIAGLPERIEGLNQITGWRLLGESLQLVGQPRAATTVLRLSQQAAQEQGFTTEVRNVDMALANGKATQLRNLNLSAIQTELSQLRVRANDPIQSVEPKLLRLSYIGDLQDLLDDYQRLAADTQTPALLRTQAQINSIGNSIEGTEVLLAGLQQLQAQTASLPYGQLIRTEFFARQGGILQQSQVWMSNAQTVLTQLQADSILNQGDRASLYARLNLFQSLLRYEQLRQRQPINVASLPQLIEPQTAIIQLKDILAQAQRNGDIQAEAYTLGYLGEWLTQTGQESESEDYLRRALAISQSRGSTDLSYRFQWDLGRLKRNQGNLAEAKQAYGAAVQSLDELRGDLVATNRDIQFSFRDSVEPVYREYVDLLLPRDGSPASQADLDQARKTVQRLQLAELDNYFREPCTLPRASLDEAINNAPEKTAALYSIVLPDRLELLLKLPGERQAAPKRFTIDVSQEQLEQLTAQAVEQVREPLESGDANNPEMLRSLGQLYDWLIHPIEADLEEIETLVFVLDGPLSSLPVAALYDHPNYQQYQTPGLKAKENFLVQNYAVAVAPSIELVSGRADPNRQSDVQAGTETSKPRVLAAGTTQEQGGFPKLPHVNAEIQYLVDTAPGTVLLDSDFTRDRLQSNTQSSSFPIVHFATHGQFGRTAEDTFLLAWQDRIKVNDLSELIKAKTLRQSTPIELLTLSACETATGNDRATLGIAGAAFRAGAKSILATLWHVNDQSSFELVKAFYEPFLEQGQSKAKSLQQAQQQLIDKGQPAYRWAPLTLVGDWL